MVKIAFKLLPHKLICQHQNITSTGNSRLHRHWASIGLHCNQHTTQHSTPRLLPESTQNRPRPIRSCTVGSKPQNQLQSEFFHLSFLNFWCSPTHHGFDSFDYGRRQNHKIIPQGTVPGLIMILYFLLAWYRGRKGPGIWKNANYYASYKD